MLQATGLGRRFGDLWAIRDVDLTVDRGEVLGLASLEGFDVYAQPSAVRAWIGIRIETPGHYDKLWFYSDVPTRVG